ncbi:hypothetical protein [Candidatus Symbiobacter mobilis]|uniref:CheW-like domain-containing protein n=1 Tax=Candidatus Symbiobacter mobilis CR TaxID=946483 RepID=U5NA58_9BURK|nr:hypothetical protein [Candidatus Symbiobacter mobilis]AGX88205.1 hypothetical protein Cenrod_2135 [Candidatus Symbiobacter mobilis CR]
MSPPATLHLLLCTVNGVAFGFDVEHVTAIAVPEAGVAPCRLLGMLGVQDGAAGRPALSTTSFVLSTRTRDGIRPIAVDDLEDIGEVDMAQLRPLPATVEPLALRTGIWAVWLRGPRMVFLLDPLRWAATPPAAPTSPAPSSAEPSSPSSPSSPSLL